MPTTITCFSAHGLATPAERRLLLSNRRDAAITTSLEWIKSLRNARYDGGTMRERFTYRGDSLWWFTELYLHKMRRLETACSTIFGLEAAVERHAPARILVDTPDDVVRQAAMAFGAAHKLPVEITGAVGDRNESPWTPLLMRLSAAASRLHRAHRPSSRPTVAAFVHTAFWKPVAAEDGPQQESYIGPVLHAIARRLDVHDLAYVGVGPNRNFRARRWWDPLTGAGGARPLVTPIQRLTSGRALSGAMQLLRQRDELARAIVASEDVRARAIVRGCDLWPILSAELDAAARVQWPWSARAMDEAGAALDALAPQTALTYAEAGGWGRAIVLEARRRGIPSIGIQHGFIYRHWLNYRHEPDEMEPNGTDSGFPLPDRTLVFDRYAAEYLQEAGRFPGTAIGVTGSARLDDLAERVTRLRLTEREVIRARLGVGQDQKLVVLAAKFSEIRRELPTLFAAVGKLRQVRLLVKAHPAETSDVYMPAAHGVTNIGVVPADSDLASLLAAADGMVTMNSTVAIDGLVIDVPALVIGLPNNLSPFVDAGVMIGGSSHDEIRRGLQTLLYDQEARLGLARRAAAFTERFGMRADGQSASRAADEVLALARREEPGPSHVEPAV